MARPPPPRGTYPLVFIASNSLGAVSQSFTLTVTQPPAITSAGSAFFTVGAAGAFTVSASGFPAPTLSASGTLPGGVAFNAGTGVLSGAPAAGASGSYPMVFTASNGVAPNAAQNFILTVGAPPFFTSANNASFPAGGFGTFTVTALGNPNRR